MWAWWVSTASWSPSAQRRSIERAREALVRPGDEQPREAIPIPAEGAPRRDPASTVDPARRDRAGGGCEEGRPVAGDVSSRYPRPRGRAGEGGSRSARAIAIGGRELKALLD